MQRLLLLAAAVAFLVPLGCGERPPGPPVPLKSFILHDVQGFHGGHALWAAEDRTAIVQVVERSSGAGLREKRYKITLTADQWAEVERLVGAHRLLDFQTSQRPGVPDEAHPMIVLVTQDGARHRARKWGDDKHADFDPVYAYLLRFCDPDGKPIHEGAFDWDWRPDGFVAPWK